MADTKELAVPPSTAAATAGLDKKDSSAPPSLQAVDTGGVQPIEARSEVSIAGVRIKAVPADYTDGVAWGATTCGTCHGAGLVPDGEIPSAFGNAPIKCVKDCPACKGPSNDGVPVEQSWQGGLSNDDLLAAFKGKLPNVEPTERDLTMFALGVEVGCSGGIEWEWYQLEGIGIVRRRKRASGVALGDDAVEVARDDDGELMIDWSPGKGRMVTMSLRADGRLSYAFLWDGEKAHGTAQMPSGAPEVPHG
jgi:hypothetical protein